MSSRKTAVRYLDQAGQIREVHYDASGRDIHVDEPLTQILVNYQPSGFIADQVAPIVGVGKQFDMIGGISQADTFRIEDTIRAPSTSPKKVALNVTSDTFFCRNYALRSEFSVEDLVNVDQVWNLRENRALLMKDILFLDWENRLATLATDTVNVSTVTAAASLWSDHDNSDPIEDVDIAARQLRAVSGYRPNVAIFGWEAWDHIRRNVAVRTQLFPAPGITTAGAGLVNAANLATVLGINKVLVAEAQHNINAEGLGLSLSELWGPHIWLAYIAPRPSREVPSWMYTFRWEAPQIANLQVEDLGFDTDIKAQKMDLGFYQDEKIIDATLATRISSVV